MIESRSLTWLLNCGAVIAVLYFTWSGQQFLVHNVYNDADSSFFIYGGRVMTEGGVLYRDFWDQKPPAIFYQNALLLKCFGLNLKAWAWVHGLLFMGVLCFAFRKFFSPMKMGVGRWWAMLWAVVTAFAFNLNNYLDMGNRTEFGLAIFEMLAMVFVWTALQKRKVQAWLLAGFCAAVASMFKPVGMASLLASLALYGLWITCVFIKLLKSKRESHLLDNRAMLALALGFGLGLMALLLPMALQGQLLEVWRATFVVPLSFTGVASHSLWDAVVDYPIKLGPLWGWLLPMVLFPLAVFRKTTSSVERQFLMWLLLWNGATFCGIVLMRHGHPHYYHPAVVPVLTLSFFSWSWALRGRSRLITWSFAALVIGCGMLFSRYFLIRQFKLVQALAEQREEQYRPYRKIAEHLKGKLSGEETFLYWSMGYSPYIHADKICPAVISPCFLNLGDGGASLVLEDLERMKKNKNILYLLENPETYPRDIAQVSAYPEDSQMRLCVETYTRWRDSKFVAKTDSEAEAWKPFVLYLRKDLVEGKAQRKFQH